MSDNNPRLSPREIQAGRVARSEAPDYRSHRGDNARDVLLLNPDQLRAGRKANPDTDEAGAPTRRVLTDPPSSMRRAASGKAVPDDYTPTRDQQAIDANPMSWLTRKFTSEDED
jgi:hypothetical protein